MRLWSPSPELATWLPRVERETLGDAWTTSSSRAACVDLGCGAGRDAVWAASRGWRVVAIDNDKKGLARCEALAEQHGVLDRVITLDVDLTKHSIDDVFARVCGSPRTSHSTTSIAATLDARYHRERNHSYSSRIHAWTSTHKSRDFLKTLKVSRGCSTRALSATMHFSTRARLQTTRACASCDANAAVTLHVFHASA